MAETRWLPLSGSGFQLGASTCLGRGTLHLFLLSPADNPRTDSYLGHTIQVHPGFSHSRGGVARGGIVSRLGRHPRSQMPILEEAFLQRWLLLSGGCQLSSRPRPLRSLCRHLCGAGTPPPTPDSHVGSSLIYTWGWHAPACPPDCMQPVLPQHPQGQAMPHHTSQRTHQPLAAL